MTKSFPPKDRGILFPIILIIPLSLVGWGISKLIGSFIPFWLLLGFSVFYSFEKWLIYYTRKYKIVGKIYRLFLNLSTLSLLGLIFWTGFALFTHKLDQSPISGSALLIGEILSFVWLFSVVSKNSWRQPSMKLTAFSLICLFLIFSFAGIQPLTSYKDAATNLVMSFYTQQKNNAALNSEKTRSDRQDENNSVSLTSIESYAEMFNQYRQSKGLGLLEFTDDLNMVAELRLKELYSDFSHDSAGNYNNHLVENIAMRRGFLANHNALVMWQNSPGHNANMLNSSYKYTGYAIGNGYAIQLFTEYPTINGEPQLPPGWYWVD